MSKHDWNKQQEEIHRLYYDLEWSQEKVAAHFGVTQQSMQKVMQRLGMKTRSRTSYGNRNGRYKHGLRSRLYKKMITKEQCQKCGAVDDLGIHHKNDDHYDNRIENLEVLCNSCHMSETKRKWWDAKKAGRPLPKSNGPVGWKRYVRKLRRQDDLVVTEAS